MSRFFTSSGQSIGVSASASVLPMNIQDWFPLGLTGLIPLQSKRTLKSLLQHHSSKASILRSSAFFMVQLSHAYMTTGKTIALTRQSFFGKVMSLLFFLSFFNFFFLLYNIVLVLHTSTLIRNGCTRVPHPEPPSLCPPHTIPLCHPSAPAPSILYPASNLDWWFISNVISYMFQCHSTKSSHSYPLPQSPKDCSIHLCLFCCLTYRVIITIFLNSIYMR